MATPLLQAQNLETYYGPIVALRGVSLEVESGQMVAVLGANGAGKTTLLNTIAGVIDPQKGQVLYQERPIQKLDPDRVAALGVRLVPEGRQVFPFLSVAENLAMGAFSRRDQEAVQQDLEQVYGYFPKLQERLRQPAGLLSGGEQQMLAIGRALMGHPEVLLLDEPSQGLSPRLVTGLFAVIQRINRELGTTILVVEQNAHAALQIADQGYVLELGRVVMCDTCERLRERPDIKEFYLGIREDGIRGKRRWRRRKTWR